jgi:hypothetical protein
MKMLLQIYCNLKLYICSIYTFYQPKSPQIWELWGGIPPYMVLGAEESNPYRLIQSQMSYHWTSPQFQRAEFYHIIFPGYPANPL